MWERIARETVEAIQNEKREWGVYPDYASMTEIRNTVIRNLKEALNGLSLKGELKWYKTVNGIPMFGIREEGR